jgi:DNA polymerase-1
VHSLHTVFGSGLFSARDIALIARKDSPSDAEVDLLDAFGIDERRGGHGVAVKVGTRLTRLIDKWYRGLSIRKDKDKIDAHTHTMKYYVVTKGDDSDPKGPSGGPGKPEPENDFFAEAPTPLTAAEQAAEGCTDAMEALEDQEEATTDTAPKPLQETLEIPDDIPDDVLDDISEPLPKIAPEPQSVPFLTTLTAEHRDLLHASPWCSFDLETTALSRASAPCILTNLTQIGGTPWKKYKDTHNCGSDTAPRARILSCTVQDGEGVRTLAWDLDALDDATKTELFGLCISGKTLIGHNLSFDLSWAAWYTDAQPARVLDTMLLIRSLWPDLPLTLHEHPDTAAAEKLINASRPGTLAGIGLASVAAALGLELPQGKAYQGPANWCPATLTPEHYEYATSDTTIALEVLYHILEHFGLPDDIPNAWKALEAKNPPGWPAYRDAFAPAIPLLARMHRLGLPLDLKGLDALSEARDKEARDCAEELIRLIPALEPFHDDLIRGGLPEGAKRAIAEYIRTHNIDVGTTPKSGVPAISDTSIRKTGADKLPFFKPWEGLREAVKLKQMLASLKNLSGVDGRLHSLISIAADTGRTTSQEPNVQNLPRDTSFRALVRAREGHVLVDADLGAIEMRIAAALAERAIREYGPGGPRCTKLPEWIIGTEEVWPGWRQTKKDEWDAAVAKMGAIGWKARLSAVFRSGIDPHIATGLSLMRAAGEAPADMPDDIISWLAKKTPEERQVMKKTVGGWRQKAKALNFGLLYGQSAGGLHDYGLTVYGLTWSPEEAEEARNVWFDTYPEVRFWQITTELGGSELIPLTVRDKYSGKMETKTKRVFFATTLSGRPLCTLTTQSILNYQDQGTGAEMLLMAMARLPEDLRPCIVDIIHDEVLLEVPEPQANYAREALEKAMVKAAGALLKPWGIGAEADAATGMTWAEAKK